MCFGHSELLAGKGTVSRAGRGGWGVPLGSRNGGRGVERLQTSKRQTSTEYVSAVGPIGSEAMFWGTAVAFSLDAFDVECPMSLNVFREPDLVVHAWVVQHIPEAWQHFLFDKVLSDAFIVLPVVAWIVVDQIWKSPSEGQGIISEDAPPESSWLYPEGGVPPGQYVGVAAGATVLMLVLKKIIARSRPNLGILTLSFPSGHTMAAVMLTSMFLLRLEFKMQAMMRAEDEEPSMISITQPAGMAVLLLAAVTTAVGRIGADAHWLSDTIAGAFLGLWATSLLANIHRWDATSD